MTNLFWFEEMDKCHKSEIQEAENERKRRKKEKRKKENEEKRSSLGHGNERVLKRKQEDLKLVELKEKHDDQRYHKSKKQQLIPMNNLFEKHVQPQFMEKTANFSERSQGSSNKSSSSTASPSSGLVHTGIPQTMSLDVS